VDGLLNVYKPVGLTSARALDQVRRITGERKSGHAGTLDPAAEGVLLICLGRGTKLVERLMDLPKVYRATARLDCVSRGFDSEKGVQPVSVARVPSEAEVRAALGALEGWIEQVPPAFSALKVCGVAAYKLARRGRFPELPPRRVHVYWIHVWRYAWPELNFEVACGRGTYIRALVRDLGVRLGTGGCLTGLVRRAVGPFHVASAWALGQLGGACPEEYVVPLDAAQRLVQESEVSAPPRPGS